jgi:hypothetical protein
MAQILNTILIVLTILLFCIYAWLSSAIPWSTAIYVGLVCAFAFSHRSTPRIALGLSVPAFFAAVGLVAIDTESGRETMWRLWSLIFGAKG